MQVEARPPQIGEPTRAASAPPWTVPVLIAGMFTSPSTHKSLLSESSERSEETLRSLKKDQQRVDDVLAGLLPTNAEQVAQTRAARHDAVEDAASHAMDRERGRQDQPHDAFRTVLANARISSTAPPPATDPAGTVSSDAPDESASP